MQNYILFILSFSSVLDKETKEGLPLVQQSHITLNQSAQLTWIFPVMPRRVPCQPAMWMCQDRRLSGGIKR